MNMVPFYSEHFERSTGSFKSEHLKRNMESFLGDYPQRNVGSFYSEPLKRSVGLFHIQIRSHTFLFTHLLSFSMWTMHTCNQQDQAP